LQLHPKSLPNGGVVTPKRLSAALPEAAVDFDTGGRAHARVPRWGEAFCGICNGLTNSVYSNHVLAARTHGVGGGAPEDQTMSQFVAAMAKGRVFGLDMGDWSVLVGGFALAGLVLFLTYPVAA
jgi:hypothetical protein